MQRRAILKIGAAALALHAAGVRAQAFPDRFLKLVVPFAPGGATDVLGLIFYRVAFQEGGVNAIGQSSALAVLLFLVTFGVAVVANRVVRRREAART